MLSTSEIVSQTLRSDPGVVASSCSNSETSICTDPPLTQGEDSAEVFPVSSVLKEFIDKHITRDILVKFPKDVHPATLIRASDDYRTVFVKWSSRTGLEEIPVDRIVCEPLRQKRARTQTAFLSREHDKYENKKLRKVRLDRNPKVVLGDMSSNPVPCQSSNSTVEEKSPIKTADNTSPKHAEKVKRRHRKTLNELLASNVDDDTSPRSQVIKVSSRMQSNVAFDERNAEGVVANIERSSPLLSKTEVIAAIASLLPESFSDRVTQVTHFFLFVFDIYHLAQDPSHRDFVTIKGDVIRRLCVPPMIYQEYSRETKFFQSQVSRIKATMLSRNYLPVASRKIWTYDMALLTKVLWASLCFRLLDTLSSFEAYGGIPAMEEWKSFHSVISKDANVKRVEGPSNGIHAKVSYPRYVTIISQLLQNDSAMMNSLVEDIQKASVVAGLVGCYNAVNHYVPDIGSYYGWQIVNDLLESKLLVGCDEDTVMPDYDKYTDATLRVIFGCNAGLSHQQQGRLLQVIQDGVFRSLGLNYDGKKVTLKNLGRAVYYYGLYVNAEAEDLLSTF